MGVDARSPTVVTTDSVPTMATRDTVDHSTVTAFDVEVVAGSSSNNGAYHVQKRVFLRRESDGLPDLISSIDVYAPMKNTAASLWDVSFDFDGEGNLLVIVTGADGVTVNWLVNVFGVQTQTTVIDLGE